MLSSPVDEIKTRLDLIETISGYITLKQAGANYKATCPFHKEKSPSFMASKEKQIWHCFGCGEGGDLFGFVMKMEGLEFPDALRLLAAKAGVKLQKQDPQILSKRNKLFDITEASARFFHELLLKHPKAEIARAYINKRALKPETVKDWQLGYSPDSWDVLLTFLKQKGFNEQDIFLAGMTVKKDGRTGFYDRFRNRLMFPISDVQGNVAGFTARVLDETKDKMGKYINTPQTAIYDKGSMLYGLDKAKTAIRKQNQAVLVEGNMDCISSHQAGVKNVVASSGTALTQHQVTLLKRFSENVALSFDADAAGENAALRGIDVALSAGLNIKVVSVPEGKDPDDCIRHNPLDWLAAINGAKPIMEHYFSRTLRPADLTAAEGKKKAANFLLAKIARLSDRVERAYYVQKLAGAINIDEAVLYSAMPNRPAGSVAPRPVAAPAGNQTTTRGQVKSQSIDRHKVLSELFVSLLPAVKDPALLGKIPANMLVEGLPADLYKNLQSYYNSNQEIASDKALFWKSWEDNLKEPTLINYKNQLNLFLDKEFEPGTSLIKELEITAFELKKLFFTRQREQLGIELRQAETLKDDKKITEILGRFSQVAKELNALN